MEWSHFETARSRRLSPCLSERPVWRNALRPLRHGVLSLIVLAAVVWVTRPASAQEPFAACLDEFWGGQPPSLSASGVLYALCASHFATLYSGQTETPLYSAEHLTEEQLERAIHQHRDDAFHEDDRLPEAVASTLDDYRHSGWDRGHMAPSGDEPDGESQFESFALSNMVPQNSDDNRHLWADIETAVRELVLASGDDIFVVTSPVFGASEPQPLRGQVWVPLLLFKAIYDPKAGIAGVYLARNAPGHQYQLLSVSDFERRYQINPFPELPEKTSMDVGNLPTPVLDRYHDRIEVVQ